MFAYLGMFEHLYFERKGCLIQEQAYMGPEDPATLDRESVFLVPKKLVNHFCLKNEDNEMIRIVCNHFLNDHEEFLKEVYNDCTC